MKRPQKHPLKLIVGTQYFLYFGAMGIILPYFNLYCYHLGFSGFQIGTLSALRTATTLLFPLLWGLLAVRFQARKPIYIICNFVSAAIWIGYFYTTDFWGMLVITGLYGIFYAPIISFLEAFTMDVLDTQKQKYGKIRVWGSISFIMLVMATGKLIDLYRIEFILFLVLALSGIQAAMSIKIPRSKVEKTVSNKPGPSALCKPRVIVFLFCAFLMLLSHGTYYGFFSIHLETLGYGNTFIGISWALASIAEISAMLWSDKIFRKMSIETVLIFSFMIAAIRWILCGFVTSPGYVLLIQVTHAVTYGTFHISSILYIDRLTPNAAKTLGQAVNNAVTYGLGIMIGFFLNGYFYERIGTFGLFFVSGAIALAGGLILLGYHLASTGHDATTRPEIER